MAETKRRARGETEELLIAGQFHQNPPHPVHVKDFGRTDLIKPIRKAVQWPWQAAGTRLVTVTDLVTQAWVIGRHSSPPF